MNNLVIIIFLIFALASVISLFIKKDSDRQKNILLIFGLAATISSWFATSYLNNNQSTNEAKRELKVKILLDAYTRLSNSNYRDTTPIGHKRNKYGFIYDRYSESALTSIQLLANDETVLLANKFILSNGKSEYLNLLNSLRNELRDELNINKLPNDLLYDPSLFRTYRKTNHLDSLTNQQEFDLVLKLNEAQYIK